MAKTVCKILGVVFLLVGVLGFAAPNLLGAHLDRRTTWFILSREPSPFIWALPEHWLAQRPLPCFRRGLSRAGYFGIRDGRGEDMMWMVGPLHFGTGRSRHSRPARRDLPGRRVIHQKSRLVSLSGCKGEFR